MSRVLITGGAGALGAAVARRLLADPAYDVRVADRRAAPLWMREGCEIRDGDLRAPAQALAATKGCELVVHLATYAPDEATREQAPYSLIEHESALHCSVVRAALERDVQRLVYVSSAALLAGAEQPPAAEQAVAGCPAPRSARAFARLAGERCCTAAHEQHGLAYAICRPSAMYGAPARGPAVGAGEPGAEPLIAELVAAAARGARKLELDAAPQRAITPTHVEDVADGVVAALGADAARNEDFNLAGERELALAELARLAAAASGGTLTLAPARPAGRGEPPPERARPSAQKARELLGWRPRVALEDGLASLAHALREQAGELAASASRAV